MTLLTVDDHPAIRAAIDIAVTRRDLPDEAISEAIYRPMASEEVELRVPGWAALTGVPAARVRRAGIYLCAALLCEITPVYTTESIGRWSGTRAGVDLAARATKLRQLYEQEIAAIVAPGDGYPTIPIFIVGKGRWDDWRPR